MFSQCGEDLDQALATFITASNKMRDSLARLNALGQGTPNKMQFDALGKDALFTALLRSPWAKYFPNVLLSSKRHSFGELTARWAAGIKANVTRRLAA